MKALPTSWAEITVGQFYDCFTIYNLFKDDHIERSIKLIALFTGQSQKEVEKMKIEDVMSACKSLDFLGTLPANEKLPFEIKLGGKIFSPCLLTKDMTAGQFIDFSNCGKGCEPDELIYHMHELLACMCLTKTDTGWEYKEYTETCELFLEMTFEEVYPLYVFFCKVLVKLQQPILEYSHSQVKKLAKELKVLQSA